MDTLTYSGNGTVRIRIGKGQVKRLHKGDTVSRGEIPDDAFNCFAVRPDFGADLDTYRQSRRGGAVAQPDVEESEEEEMEEEEEG